METRSEFEFPTLVFCSELGYETAYAQDGVTWEEAVFDIRPPLNITGWRQHTWVYIILSRVLGTDKVSRGDFV